MTSAECCLFHSAVKVSDADLDALVGAGKGVEGAIALLRRVQAYPLQFASTGALVRLISTLATLPSLPPPITATFPAIDRDGLFDALASDACNVFSSNVKLSNKSLDKLLCAGRGLQPCLAVLHLMGTRAEQVQSVGQLVGVVEAEVEAAYAALVEMALYFASPTSPLAVIPQAEALLQLYWQMETGMDCLDHLKALPKGEVGEVAALLPMVSASRNTDLMQVNAELAALHQQMGLGGGEGGKSARVGWMRAALTADVEGLTVYQCWRLARAGRVGLGPSNTPAILQQLIASEQSFGDVERLIEAVRAVTTAAERQTKAEQPPRTVVAPTHS